MRRANVAKGSRSALRWDDDDALASAHVVLDIQVATDPTHLILRENMDIPTSMDAFVGIWESMHGIAS